MLPNQRCLNVQIEEVLEIPYKVFGCVAHSLPIARISLTTNNMGLLGLLPDMLSVAYNKLLNTNQ